MATAALLGLALVVATVVSLAEGKTVPQTNVTVTTRACLPPYNTFPFCNTSLSLDTRIRDLISRIHDEDKPHLLTARENGGDSPGPGSNISYLGIPGYNWGVNCLSSAQTSCVQDYSGNVICPTMFANPVNFGASFNTSMYKSYAQVISTELRSLWVNGATEYSAWSGRRPAGLDCWAPVININRDPRWGRNMEVPSEDPFLNGVFGTQFTIGLQVGEDSNYIKVIVTLKHWDAYSLEDSDGFTRHNFNAVVKNSTLQDTYFPAFKASVQQGKAKGVMCSYNAVNGVPTCASPFLANVLRDQWGFDGYMTSDTGAIQDIYQEHKYVATAEEAACVAIRDGRCDVNSGPVYHDALLKGVADGHCSMADVDQALYNTIKLRFELGLFDPIESQPYWHLPLSVVNTTASQQLNRLATRESMVLLQNPGNVLPLTAGKKIAAIGPHALAQSALVGNYIGQMCADDSFNCIQTPLDALTQANVGGTTQYSEGCTISGSDTSKIAAAVSLAKESDVVVLYLGIDVTVEAESHDRTSIDLPGVQHQLAAAILALKKPTVIVLINGGMVAIAQEKASAAAILSAGYPGFLGSSVIAETLFGNNPSLGGKLPYTVYDADYVNQIKMDNMEMDDAPGRSYRYYTGTPLFEFGFGMSLTTFNLTVVKRTDNTHSLTDAVELSTTSKDDQSITFYINVTNIGSRWGDEVVFGFNMPVDVPKLKESKLIMKLNFFQRVHLAPGQSTIVKVTIQGSTFAMVDTISGDKVIAPGQYNLVLTNRAGQESVVKVMLRGPSVVVDEFPRF